MRLHEVPRLQVQAAECLVLKLPVTFLNVIVALPVPFQDRFINDDFGEQKVIPFFASKKVSERAPKWDLEIDANLPFDGSGACLEHVQTK